MISSTEKTARARARVPARAVLASWVWALVQGDRVSLGGLFLWFERWQREKRWGVVLGDYAAGEGDAEGVGAGFGWCEDCRRLGRVFCAIGDFALLQEPFVNDTDFTQHEAEHSPLTCGLT